MSDNDQSWFAARLIFESVHGHQRKNDRLFEDRTVLVRAQTEDEAREKAKSLGKSTKGRYESAEGDTVTWVLREVLDLKWVFDEVIEDRSEVYSSFSGQDELEHVKKSFEPNEARA